MLKKIKCKRREKKSYQLTSDIWNAGSSLSHQEPFIANRGEVGHLNLAIALIFFRYLLMCLRNVSFSLHAIEV